MNHQETEQQIVTDDLPVETAAQQEMKGGAINGQVKVFDGRTFY